MPKDFDYAEHEVTTMKPPKVVSADPEWNYNYVQCLGPHERLAWLRDRLYELDRDSGPHDWIWDFTHVVDQCGTSGCALGFYYSMTNRHQMCQSSFLDLAAPASVATMREFGIEPKTFLRFFLSWDDYGWDSGGRPEVTPRMVADNINEYLHYTSQA